MFSDSATSGWPSMQIYESMQSMSTQTTTVHFLPSPRFVSYYSAKCILSKFNSPYTWSQSQHYLKFQSSMSFMKLKAISLL